MSAEAAGGGGPMTRHAETRYVDDWNVRRDGPTVFLDLYPPGATAADPPACSIALNRIAAENIGRNLQWAAAERERSRARLERMGR